MDPKFNKKPESDNIVELDEYITHQTLWFKLKNIEDYKLTRLEDEIKDVKEFTRQNRKDFNLRMDKLDNRIWAIMFFAVTTLVGIAADFFLK